MARYQFLSADRNPKLAICGHARFPCIIFKKDKKRNIMHSSRKYPYSPGHRRDCKFLGGGGGGGGLIKTEKCKAVV